MIDQNNWYFFDDYKKLFVIDDLILAISSLNSNHVVLYSNNNWETFPYCNDIPVSFNDIIKNNNGDKWFYYYPGVLAGISES